MEFTQYVANGLISASVFALVAIGVGLIYRVSGFLDFSQAAVFTMAPYLTYALMGSGTSPLWCAATLGVIASMLFGLGMGLAVYSPLRRRGGTWLTLCLASLGAYVVVQNAVSLFCGDDIKSIRTWGTTQGVAILGARVTTVQLAMIACSVCVTLFVSVGLRTTRLGRSIRAVANDEELAASSGVSIKAITVVSFVASSLLVGIAGILNSLDVDMSPGMGLPVLVMAIAALVVGGMRSIIGIAIGSVLLGMARQLGAWVLGAEWQDAIAFGVLLVFLLFRSHGILGQPTRKSHV